MKLRNQFILMVTIVGLAFAAVFAYKEYSKRKLVEQFRQVDCYKEENRELYLQVYQQENFSKHFIVLMVNHSEESNETDLRIQDLIEFSDFDHSRYERYNNYLLNNETITAQQALAVVNNSIDLKMEKFDPRIIELLERQDINKDFIHRYINTADCYDITMDQAIVLVENDIDLINLSKSDNETTLKLLEEKYFIKKNLKRYLNYYSSHSKLSLTEIVKRVNSNIDEKFYTDVKSTDLTKGNLLICNKYNKLSESYVPENLVTISSTYSSAGARLVKEAAEAFEYMCKDAANYGQTIRAYGDNGYRSYSYQKDLYNYYANAYGTADADEISARPGYSEHQSGYAIDVMVNGSKYNTNHQLDWLMANSYKYGFIYRYQEPIEYITGYQNEPWHYRYVGKEVAQFIHDEGVTFEEYYAYFVADNSITTEQFVEMFIN